VVIGFAREVPLDDFASKCFRRLYPVAIRIEFQNLRNGYGVLLAR
jgi:hypothetical protein